MDPDADRMCPKADCTNEADSPHMCPYRYELFDDDSEDCECCESCTQECAWDV